MKLSKKALQEKAAELVCPPGTYEAKLNSVSWTDKPSGMWAVLVLFLGFQFIGDPIFQPVLRTLVGLFTGT